MTARIEAPKAAAPTGRVEVTGKVVMVKCYLSESFGTTTKMLVVFEMPDGSVWKGFGSVPKSLLQRNDLSGIDLQGSQVTFTATFAPKELGFAYFSRPSKASTATPGLFDRI